MAAQVKQLLNSLSNAGGSHKDITGKYREILEKIFKFNDSSLTEGLKTFIEAGKCIFFFMQSLITSVLESFSLYFKLSVTFVLQSCQATLACSVI